MRRYVVVLLFIIQVIFSGEMLVDSLVILQKMLLTLKTALPQINKLFEFTTFGEWHNFCASKPANELQISLNEFKNALATFNAAEKEQLLKMPWFGERTPTAKSAVFNPPDDVLHPIFDPYVQKATVKAGTTILFHADFHGDINSLRHYLNEYIVAESDFKLKDPEICMVFLGDYTDRGFCSTEVLYALMRLKLANPDKVFLLRGNHEDIAYNHVYGFYDELRRKYALTSTKYDKHKISQEEHELIAQIDFFYNLLPVALFLGVEKIADTVYLLCCHGGLEIGYDPNGLLKWNQPSGCSFIGKLKVWQVAHEKLRIVPETQPPRIYMSEEMENELLLNELSKKRLEPIEMGYMWNDFNVNPTTESYDTHQRAYSYGKKLTEKLLSFYSGDADDGTPYKVVGIFRGHQHSPDPSDVMMQDILKYGGVSKLWPSNHPAPHAVWEGIVCTFNVTPETYGKKVGFEYDAHGVLKTSNMPFETWTLEVQQLFDGKKEQKKPTTKINV